MIINKKSLILVSFFLILATVTSLEVRKTEFVISTNPYLNLSISVIDPDTGDEVELFEGRARKFGEFRFTYYGTVDKVSLKVRAINNETGEVIKEETLGPYTLGTPTVNFNFSISAENEEPEIVEQNLPETEVTEVSTTEESASGGSPIVGLVIGDNGKFRQVYYYILAGIIGLAVFVILMRKKLSVKSGPTEPHPSKVVKKTKSVPAKTEVPVESTPSSSNESNINDTEKRIADLQKQLEQIRNEEKLARLQKQLSIERQSLKKLQDENNPPPAQNNPESQNKIN